MLHRKKILIAPLDWGLGHATRCIPIIKEKLKAGHEVMLASNGRSAALLKLHFPQLQFLENLPDYKIRYGKSGFLLLQLSSQIPHILATIKAEKKWLSRTIEQYQIEEVLSDNRYGLYNSRTESSIITHQIFPKGPRLFQSPATRFIHQHIEKFDNCLIPDHEDATISLGGELCHGQMPNNARYIGPLSRFMDQQDSVHPAGKTEAYTFLILLSGPEPQRSILEHKLIKAFRNTSESVCIVGGKPELSERTQIENITLYPHRTDEELYALLKQSQYIITRSGYSTLMDLHAINRKALLVPTPGQTEQEYLATYHSAKFGFSTISQSALSLANIFRTLAIK